jgi:hypothetical protein
MSELLSILGIIATGLVGYLFGRREEKARAADRRPIVASALLAELQSLEIGLRRLAKNAQAARSTIYPDSTTYVAFRTDLVLFDPRTAQALILFYGLIDEITSSRARMRDEDAQLTERAHTFIRNKATYAANRIPDLKKKLEAAGGLALETEDVTWISDTGIVPIGEPAFESTKQLPGT